MQLSWAISKLKNIELDEFSTWQLTMLHEELGNEKVNSIWEVDVPAGWEKPTLVNNLLEMFNVIQFAVCY